MMCMVVRCSFVASEEWKWIDARRTALRAIASTVGTPWPKIITDEMSLLIGMPVGITFRVNLMEEVGGARDGQQCVRLFRLTGLFARSVLRLICHFSGMPVGATFRLSLGSLDGMRSPWEVAVVVGDARVIAVRQKPSVIVLNSSCEMSEMECGHRGNFLLMCQVDLPLAFYQ